MGIFTRFRDIVSSNINAILEKAEDPEKMVRLMILEMEDTLVEVKSSCAGVIADQKRLERLLEEAHVREDDWTEKAELAVRKGRDDMARSALNEKRAFANRAASLSEELARTRETVAHFQSDIGQLEAKLNDARDKQRVIVQRRQAAMARREAQSKIRRADTHEAFMKFEAYENSIDRLEAEADLVDSLRPKEMSLREQFADLEHEDEVELELEKLKKTVGVTGKHEG